MFIAVDGIDGAGKTTLVNQLAELLAPLRPVITKEPTSDSEWGRALRTSAVRGRLPKDDEVRLFHLDRLHHIDEKIGPALEAGKVVITDRYVDSTLAFQAHDPEEAEALYEGFVGEILTPDLTLILDCPVEIGLARITAGRGERSTFEDVATLERAQTIYRSRQGPNYVHIDASRTVWDTLRQAKEAMLAKFPALGEYLCVADCSSEVRVRA